MIPQRRGVGNHLRRVVRGFGDTDTSTGSHLQAVRWPAWNLAGRVGPVILSSMRPSIRTRSERPPPAGPMGAWNHLTSTLWWLLDEHGLLLAFILLLLEESGVPPRVIPATC